MIIVVSDPKTGKSYQKKTEEAGFLLNKKLKEEVTLDALGLEGYSGKISGGSDKQGFPMHPSIPGTARKKAFLSKGVGIKTKRKGEKRRKTIHGNTISNETAQVNIKVTTYGKKSVDSMLGKKETQAKEGKEGEKAEKGKEKPIDTEKKPEAGKKEEKPAEKPKQEKTVEKKTEVKEKKE